MKNKKRNKILVTLLATSTIVPAILALGYIKNLNFTKDEPLPVPCELTEGVYVCDYKSSFED